MITVIAYLLLETNLADWSWLLMILPVLCVLALIDLINRYHKGR